MQGRVIPPLRVSGLLYKEKKQGVGLVYAVFVRFSHHHHAAGLSHGKAAILKLFL
jgi:hypothetical protein